MQLGKGGVGGWGCMREGWGWLMELARVEDAPQQHVQMFANRKTATKTARLSFMMEETERRTNRARKKKKIMKGTEQKKKNIHLTLK